VRDGFKEREVARLERTRGVWTGEFIHISYYAARRSQDTEAAKVRKADQAGIRSFSVRNSSYSTIFSPWHPDRR
jgi:hypothetical protein